MHAFERSSFSLSHVYDSSESFRKHLDMDFDPSRLSTIRLCTPTLRLLAEQQWGPPPANGMFGATGRVPCSVQFHSLVVRAHKFALPGIFPIENGVMRGGWWDADYTHVMCSPHPHMIW